ncbi:MAG: PAS domain-containing protein [Alphaproteobacteria bacterium]
MDLEFQAQSRHPLIQAAAKYWLDKCGNRPMPSRTDLDPCEIPALLPHILLLDVGYDPLDFRYRLIGTAIDQHMNEPRTGQRLRSIPHQAPGSTLWRRLEAVVADRRPMADNVDYVGRYREFKLAEDIILPLSDDALRVDMLLVAVAFVRKDRSGTESDPAQAWRNRISASPVAWGNSSGK